MCHKNRDLFCSKYLSFVLLPLNTLKDKYTSVSQLHHSIPSQSDTISNSAMPFVQVLALVCLQQPAVFSFLRLHQVSH
jgi:hypothetical protein